MSDYEATAYLSLEKLKVKSAYSAQLFCECRKNICLNFNSSKTRSGMNCGPE